MSPKKKSKFVWEDWPDEKLLDLKIKDLGVTLEDCPTFVLDCISRLYDELESAGIEFRPHFWLSNEWFTPDGVPGVALPFYLAHPSLLRLEKSQMFEAEGSQPQSCMRILRHETGHAFENAFDLRKKRIVHKVFGRSSKAYPETYSPKPYSKRFVLHLDSWYAQSHPDEDFAETFAVWLTPSSNWRERYKGWGALKKLELMDELVEEIRGKKPSNRSSRKVDPVSKLKGTLREFYEERISHYGLNYPDFYDRDLRRLFATKANGGTGVKASRFMRRHRKEVRRTVSFWTETYRYRINQVIGEMIQRADELELYLKDTEQDSLNNFKLLIAVRTMDFLHSGQHLLAL